jgi:hypothetical protein
MRSLNGAEGGQERLAGRAGRGGGAGGSSAASSSSSSSSSSAAAAAPAPPDPTSIYSQQTCYLSSDESEICVYENALCFDGEGPVVVVANPIRQPPRVLDYTHECVDGRYYEPSALEWSNCHWAYAIQRPYLTQDVKGDPSTEYSLPLGLRRWGPQNRNTGLIFREMAPLEVYGAGEDSLGKGTPSPASGSSGPEIATGAAILQAAMAAGRLDSPQTALFSGVAADDLLLAVDTLAPYDHPEIPGLPIRARYTVRGVVEGPRPPPPASEDLLPGPAPLLPARLFGEVEAPPATAAAIPDGGGEPSDPVTVEWLDGPLWMVGMEAQWGDNPFHFLAKASMLFDAQRNNASHGPAGDPGGSFESGGHPADGFIHWQADSDIAIQRSVRKLHSPQGSAESRNRALFRQGGQWGPLPGLDNVLFVGEGSAGVADASKLGPWAKGVLGLSVQPHTRLFFEDVQSKYSKTHLLCARRGGVVGTKYRIFSGPGDAIIFRNAAYKAAGVEREENGKRVLGSFPRFPPRRLTLLNREGKTGRALHNYDEVIRVLDELGLPYDIVPDLRTYSFEEQVRLMSRTGILVATHGAALTNAAFLPAHAAVIELFPYGLKKATYRTLSTTIGLHYFSLYSRERMPTDSEDPAASLLYSRYYYENCVATNISSYDAVSTHACNQAAKLHPVRVPIDAFRETLWHAADSVGAFSRLNPEWTEEAERLGLDPLTYEEWIEGRPLDLVGDNVYDKENLADRGPPTR